MNALKLYIIGSIVNKLPETRFFGLKRWLYRLCGAQIGKNVRICSSCKILGNGNLYIGNNTWIGPECLISATSNIMIGNNCDIAPRVYIGNGTHEITPNRPRVADIELSKDIKIGDGCWICAGSFILPGLEIGNKSVIAAGSVVNKSVVNYSLVGGVPGKLIKRLKNENIQ